MVALNWLLPLILQMGVGILIKIQEVWKYFSLLCVLVSLFAMCSAEKCLLCIAALAVEELGFERFHALIQ